MKGILELGLSFSSIAESRFGFLRDATSKACLWSDGKVPRLSNLLTIESRLGPSVSKSVPVNNKRLYSSHLIHTLYACVVL